MTLALIFFFLATQKKIILEEDEIIISRVHVLKWFVRVLKSVVSVN